MKLVQLCTMVTFIFSLNGCLFSGGSESNNDATTNNNDPLTSNNANTCGNNSIEAGEDCDGTNFGDETCSTLMPGTVGDLTCVDCEIVTDNCSTCNNGAFDVKSEECDGQVFNGETCQTQMSEGAKGAEGNLVCTNCSIDTTGCRASCDNEILEEGEECQGSDFGGQTCESQMSEGSAGAVGDLVCTNCQIDTMDCSAMCGNGIVEEGEECDGSIPPDACAEIVGEGSTGTPVCNTTTCQYEVGNCTQVYKQISAGGVHTCALKYDNTVRCWGAGGAGEIEDFDFGQSVPPTTKFTKIDAGSWHNCGIDSTGSALCWGRDLHNQTSGGIVAGNFVEISVGVFHTCGRSANNVVKCWGKPTNFKGIEALSINSIGSGRDRTCYLEGQQVSCTDHSDGDISSGLGKYISINAGGGSLFCGIPTEPLDLPCWGSAVSDGTPPIIHLINPTPLPIGGFKAVGAGRFHACGMTQDDRIQCWGRETSYLRDLPSIQTFKEISVGDFHACGLTMDGQARCWGINNHGQTTIPTTERLLKD